MKSTFKNIMNFILSKDEIIFIVNNGNFTQIFDFNYDKPLYNLNKEIFFDTFLKINNGYFLRDSNGDGYHLLLNNSNGLAKIPDIKFGFTKKRFTNIITVYKGKIFDRVYGFLKFSDFKSVLNVQNDNILLEEEHIIFSYKNNIKLASSWQYTFNFPKYKDLFDEKLHEVKVEQLIGVLDNELYVLFSGNRIVSIDVQTGKELCNIEDVGKLVNMPLVIDNVHLDKNNKKLKIVKYLYIEIDTQTKEVQLLKNLAENTKEKIGINKTRYYEEEGDLIYFIGKQPDDLLNIVAGIFNTKSLEFEWYVRAPHNKYYTDAPQANNKYIGVQDNDNNLYLWERQEIENVL